MFKRPCWYLNFNTLFIKTWVLFERRKIILWNIWHFVENKMAWLKSAVKSPCCLNIWNEFLGVFLHVFAYVNVGHVKINTLCILNFVHMGGIELCVLLGYDILLLDIWFWAFFDNVLLLFSRLEMSKKNRNFSWTFQPLKLNPSPTHPPTHFDSQFIHLSTSPCVCPGSDIVMILMVVHFYVNPVCSFLQFLLIRNNTSTWTFTYTRDYL